MAREKIMSIGNFESSIKLLEKIKRTKFMIYGTGYVADRFCKALEMNGIFENIKCFVNTEGKPRSFKGLTVIKVEELVENYDGTLICIAVHEAIRDDIVYTLEAKGIRNYIWIYPYFHEMLYGKCIKRGIKVSIEHIWQAIRDSYSLESKYGVLEEYYGKSKEGYDIYYKMSERLFSKETAEKRLKRYQELIESYLQNGFMDAFPVKIGVDGTLFDGAHRVTIALYHNQKEILCDVYDCDKNHIRQVGGMGLYWKDDMPKLNLEASMIEALEQISIKIEEKLTNNKGY